MIILIPKKYSLIAKKNVFYFNLYNNKVKASIPICWDRLHNNLNLSKAWLFKTSLGVLEITFHFL